MNDNSSRVIEVDINDVLPNRNQPRIILNEEDDLGLTDSVKEYGVLQPIIVRTIGDKYEIIAGERRYRASVLAGKETVPVIIKNMTDKESAEVALIENVQRKELTPIEEALSYKAILDKGYMTQEQLAEKIGKSQPTIANKIRLLNLSDEVQEALLENQISERHARSLLKIKNKASQNKMLERIIKERLTVRKTDEEISKLLEEGEENMNNELNNMPQFESYAGSTIDIPQQPAPAAEPTPAPTAQPSIPTFDIFANAEAPAQAAPAFDIFQNPESDGDNETQGGTSNTMLGEQVQTAEPIVIPAAAVETMAPAPVAEPTPAAPTFDIFANTDAPAAEPAATPAFDIFADNQPAPAAPTFDIFANADAPAAEPAFNIFADNQPASAPTAEPIVIPASAVEAMAPVDNQPTPSAEPIVIPAAAVAAMEQTDNQPAEVFTTAPVQEEPVQPVQTEVKPEPIIITDYNKQYDPVMPTAPVQEPVSFKDVIAAIRECAEKIESYGYKIDVDEFDLTNIYQAIFKIEKM